MIPKKIHYCWFGGKPLPQEAKDCIDSWRRYCPDYEIIEWNEGNYDVHKNRYMSDAYKNKKWGFVPDYARLDLIYQHGGIYMDTDVELIKPIDDLLDYEAYAGIESPGTVALGLGFGAAAGNHIIKEMRDFYDTFSFYKADGTLDLTASPVLQTKILKKYGLNEKDENQVVSGMHIFASEYFCPIKFSTNVMKKTKNTYSIHHYTSSWYTPKQARLRKLKLKMHNAHVPAPIQKLIIFPFRVVIIIDNVGISKFFMLLKNRIEEKVFNR